MTWFKVDDKLHSHRKALRAGEAMALWTLAGSWCMDQLSDGFVPDYIAQRLFPLAWEQYASRLVDVGLWHPAISGDEKGWQFHEFNEAGRQPTREQVLLERAAVAERQARWRASSKRRSNGVTNGVSNADVTPLVTPSPTRPDPPLKGGGEEAHSSDQTDQVDHVLRERVQQLPIIEDPKAHIRQTIAASPRKTPGGKP